MTLYLFTSSYPFGYGGGFLEEEAIYLSKTFDKVVVIPFANFNNDKQIDVPSNFEITECILKTHTKYNIRGMFNIHAFPLFLLEFFRFGVYKDKIKFRNWLIEYNHACSLLNSRVCKNIKKQLKQEDVIYSYWGRDAYTLSVFWEGRCKFVSRFHGSTDLWEEASHDYKPLRGRVMQKLNLAAPVSEKGSIFLKSKYDCKNIMTSPLGGRDLGVGKKSNDGIYRILSCSNIIPLKRVPMILESVKRLNNIKVEWTHIGSGIGMDEILSLSKIAQNENLRINILGQFSHENVLLYYKNHPVDAFINLSTIEGVPVSIMEAISFDIPVIATDVGATSEVVTQETGILLPTNPSVEEVANALMQLRDNVYTPRKFWNEHYNADKNFTLFSSLISNL